MFNGLKDLIRRNKPETDDEIRKSKRGKIVIIIMLVLTAANIVIQFVAGDAEYRAETLAFMKDNFHINWIDASIMAVMLIILIIVKIKKKKEK